MEAPRPWDLVLFGATGFVGRLIAAYLAEHAPPGFRWALAGRSPEKLADLRASLAEEGDPGGADRAEGAGGADCADRAGGASRADRAGRAGSPSGEGRQPGQLVANIDDPTSLAAMAASAKVVLTTVGPYLRWGEPVVAACVRAGTHYLDLTGEPAYVAGLVERWHAAAEARGVALIPCCGFDSIPTDLGVYVTAKRLPPGVPLEIRGYMEGRGSFSGGTLASALQIFGEDRVRGAQRTIAPRESADGRRLRPLAVGLHRAPVIAGWGLPLPTIDPAIALRSAGLLADYGPDFTYGHYLARPNLAAVAATGVGGGLFLGAVRLRAVRKLLSRLRPPGTGPSPERRAKSWFRFTFVGEGGGQRVVTQIRGGDPGYDETAKMMAEAGILVAQGAPPRGGVLTPAVALGDRLVTRLGEVGLELREIT